MDSGINLEQKYQDLTLQDNEKTHPHWPWPPSGGLGRVSSPWIVCSLVIWNLYRWMQTSLSWLLNRSGFKIGRSKTLQFWWNNIRRGVFLWSDKEIHHGHSNTINLYTNMMKVGFLEEWESEAPELLYSLGFHGFSLSRVDGFSHARLPLPKV